MIFFFVNISIYFSINNDKSGTQHVLISLWSLTHVNISHYWYFSVSQWSPVLHEPVNQQFGRLQVGSRHVLITMHTAKPANSGFLLK